MRRVCCGVLLVAGCGGGPNGQTPTKEAPPAKVDPAAVVVDTAPARVPSPVERLRAALELPTGGTFKRVGDDVSVVDLSGTEVADLTPLRGFGVKSLDLRGTPVTDLSPLAGVRLVKLFAEETRVTDLRPLTGMPLTTLYLTGAPVTDIGPLRDATLAELNLVDTPVADLGPLATARLGTLWLRRTKVRDLSPLAGRELVSLDVAETAVEDLAPLRGMMSLRRLQIADTAVTDLSPLAGLRLERLVFTPANITSGIEAVRSMTSLRDIDVRFEDNGSPLSTATEFWARYDAGGFDAG